MYLSFMRVSLNRRTAQPVRGATPRRGATWLQEDRRACMATAVGRHVI